MKMTLHLYHEKQIEATTPSGGNIVVPLHGDGLAGWAQCIYSCDEEAVATTRRLADIKELRKVFVNARDKGIPFPKRPKILDAKVPARRNIQ